MVTEMDGKEMKKGGGFRAVLLVSIIAFLVGVAFAAPVNPQMEIKDYSFSESPAMPGGTVTLTMHMVDLSLVNCAQSVDVGLMLSSPLSLQGRDTQNIGDICHIPDTNAPSTDTNGMISFKVVVDNSAASGNYPIIVNTTYGLDYSKFSNSDTIYLTVSGRPNFTASIASSNPSDIYPGDTASIMVTLQNNGSGKAQSTRVGVSSTAGLEVNWASASQELGQVNGFGRANVPVQFDVPKSIAPGDYNLSLDVNYLNESNAPVTQGINLVVTVKPKADFEITQKEQQTLLNGNSTLVKLNLANTGTAGAQKIKVRLMPTFPFSSDGTVRYIENLPAGQSTELDYQITTDNTATSGNQLLSVIVDYQNSEQKDFSGTVDFFLPVRTKNIIDILIENAWIIVVIIAIVAVFVLRGRGKGKKK